MRSLANRELARTAVPAGLILGILCTPLILQETSDPMVRLLQLITLPLLASLLIQAALAWTPQQMTWRPETAGESSQRLWLELVALAGLVALFRCALDPALRRMFVLRPMTSWAGFARKLPFVVMAQPLMLIAGVYSFAYRLSQRSQVAVATVILVHQAVVIMQFGQALDFIPLAAMAVIAGIDGLVGAISYVRFGLAGPLVISLFVYSRHGIYLAVD